MSASGRPARSRALAAATVVGLGAMAAGCSASNPANAERTCPRVVSAPGTAVITFFRPGSHDPKDLMVGGRIADAAIKCAHEPTGVAVNAEIHFYAQRASAAVKDATFPYFLAVVDPQMHVLAQKGFSVHFAFIPGEQARDIPTEKITVHLPLHNPAAAGDYAVIVGFQLTPEQLAFNRAEMAR